MAAKTLAPEVAAFLMEQRARGVSPHTLRARKGDLGKLLAHAAGSAWPGWEVKPRTLRGFALELGERGLDPASQARILSTVRSFYGWLFETHRIGVDPSTGLRNPKLPRRLPAFLTEGESSALLDLPEPLDFPTSRLRCLLELLYACGLRVSELTGLDLQDLLQEERTLRVLGKGRKERLVPFHEQAGAVLERLLQDALAGMEADFYAESPVLAKALSRRLATFAFLRGGRKPGFAERKLEVEEVDAALGALAFAHARNPRLFLVRGMERVTPELLDLVRGLVNHSKVPWLLSFRGAGNCQGLNSTLESLRNNPASATVILDRLEDPCLPEVLGDLLGPHTLGPAFVAQVCAACLGNPGLLQGILEMALLQGSLVWLAGVWTCPQGGMPRLETQEGQRQGILKGRLDRLGPQAQGALEILALADGPMPPAILGRMLGLDADGVEEALSALASAKLALLIEGRYCLSGTLVKELVLARMQPGSMPVLAKALLKARALSREAGSRRRLREAGESRVAACLAR